MRPFNPRINRGVIGYLVKPFGSEMSLKHLIKMLSCPSIALGFHAIFHFHIKIVLIFDRKYPEWATLVNHVLVNYLMFTSPQIIIKSFL